MTMGASVERDEAVLKLIHPGGFVEIHRRPVVASQVMKKNPRHFVTRPDVFQFPWIVVRPESVLMPGNVFLIVPYHTIDRLLKAHEPPFEPHRAPGPNNRHRQRSKQSCINSSHAKRGAFDKGESLAKPSHRCIKQSPIDSSHAKLGEYDRDESLVKPSRRCIKRSSINSSRERRGEFDRDESSAKPSRRCVKQSPIDSFHAKRGEFDRDESLAKPSRRRTKQPPIDSFGEKHGEFDRDESSAKPSRRRTKQPPIDSFRKKHGEFDRDESSAKPSRRCIKQSPIDSSDAKRGEFDRYESLEKPTKQGDGFEIKFTNKTTLKSCLRKHEGGNLKSCCRKVRFLLPNEAGVENSGKKVRRFSLEQVNYLILDF